MNNVCWVTYIKKSTEAHFGTKRNKWKQVEERQVDIFPIPS